MKKVFQASALLVVIAAVLASCHASPDCPAYGKHGQYEVKQEKRF